MNKTKAKQMAQNNTMTWGEIAEIIEGNDLSGMSKVNKSLTRQQVYGIFKNMLDVEKDKNDVPKGMVYSVRKNKEIMSSSALGIMNILREFG